MLPLTALPPERAFAVWMGLSLIALAAMLVVIGRAIDLRVWGFASLAAATALSRSAARDRADRTVGVAAPGAIYPGVARRA